MNPAEQHLPHHLQRCATVPTYVGRPEPEVYDDLNPKDQLQVRKLIPKKEKIFYSGCLKKINKRLIPQNRILVVTDKALYNIQPKEDFLISLAFSISPGSALKRKIDIQKIFAITLSVRAIGEHEQFVINVNGEYDYRYDAGPRCERVIKSILKSYFLHFKVPFILYLREEADLVEFHTTDDDLKASVDKRPKDGKIFITPEIMAKGLPWIIANRKTLLQQTNMFYSVQNMPTNQDQFVQQASVSAGPQFQGQVQNPSLNQYQVVSNAIVQPNPLHRAQSMGDQPNVRIVGLPAQVNSNNAQLNFQNTGYNQGGNQGVGYGNNNNNVNVYQGAQYDFVPNDLVATTANYNVQITTNFEDSLKRKGQNGVYYQ